MEFRSEDSDGRKLPEVDLAVTESSEKEAKGKKPAAMKVAKSAKKVVTPV